MKKHCKRKVWPLTNPFASNAPLCQAAHDELQLRELMALELFANGEAEQQEWADLKAFIDLVRTAANMGIGPEAIDACDSAMHALIESARACETTGVLIMDADGVAVIREVLAFADAQRRAIPGSEYQRVVQRTIDSMEYA